MIIHTIFHRSNVSRQSFPNRRRGVTVVLAAILMVLMLALLAFTIDLGYLLSTRTELQRTADAAALMGAWEMADADFNVRVLQTDNWADMDDNARLMSAELAAKNEVVNTNPQLALAEDIAIGYLANPSDHSETLSFPSLDKCNTVQVRVLFSEDRNKPVSFFFAPVIGINSSALSATAAATYANSNTVGFQDPGKTGKSSLMPFTIKTEDWDNLLDGGGDDNWAVNPETGAVSPGQDGIPEMRMFPEKSKNKGKGGGGITPGNFGTVDIGNTNNAAPDLWRQIREGPSSEDFAHYPNHELKLDPVTKKLYLNGDTGITASMKSALGDIIGEPRTILLYNDVTGQGNNTWFTIEGFAGIRVLDYSMRGNDKYILIQPSMVYDNTAISGDTDSSDFVGPPVHLVR